MKLVHCYQTLNLNDFLFRHVYHEKICFYHRDVYIHHTNDAVSEINVQRISARKGDGKKRVKEHLGYTRQGKTFK